jgi:hypothetical protein
MHRSVSLLALAVLLTGCGTGAAEIVTRGDPPDPSSPSPTAKVSGILADFPLDLGYAGTNGDDGSPVAITHAPATRRFRVCDRRVWDPRAGSDDLIGVEFRGEAEYFRGRTLVLYPDSGSAARAVTTAGHGVTACPDEPDGHGHGTTHTMVDRPLGDQSVVWTDTYYSLEDGEQRHDTGLVVYEMARVGRVVLLVYEYGEANGFPVSRDDAVRRTTRETRALVTRMRDLPTDVS